MLSDIRKLFYGIIKINEVEFVNKLKPNKFVALIGILNSITKTIYYSLTPKVRSIVFKSLVNIKKYENNLFDTVYFELRTRCNSQCTFCMASIFTDNRDDIAMPINLYDKIINELAEENFSGTIGFYVNNEPLLVKNLDQYINIARKKLDNASLRILTNGLKLNPINGQMLLDCGINEIEVNLYQSSLKTVIPKGLIKFENEVLKPLLNNKKVKVNNTFKYKNRNVRYHKVLRKVNEILTTRGGTAPNMENIEKVYDGFCAYPFWQLNITADGRVAQCCADFYFDNVNLNCKQDNIYDIWRSKFFTNLRKDLLNGDRSKNNMCKKCDYAGENPRRAKSFFGKLFLGLIT